MNAVAGNITVVRPNLDVRREKTVLSQWVRDQPGNFRSSRKQSEQSWR